MPEPEREALLERLERDSLLQRHGATHRTTKRWQGAMMRAASRLYAAGDPGEDLRIPITLALLELYGPDTPDSELAALVAVLVPIEVRELGAVLPPRPP